MSDAVDNFPKPTREEFDAMNTPQQRDIARIQAAQVEEKLKRAQMLATDNLGLALDRKNEVLGELLTDCKEMLGVWKKQLKEHLADESTYEVDWLQKNSNPDRGDQKKVLVGKLRGKDRRVNSFISAVEKFERIAHHAATVPQVFKKGDTNIFNMQFNYTEEQSDASSDWEKTKKSAVDAEPAKE